MLFIYQMGKFELYTDSRNAHQKLAKSTDLKNLTDFQYFPVRWEFQFQVIFDSHRRLPRQHLSKMDVSLVFIIFAE